MTRTWWSKFALLVFCVVLSVVYVFPTVTNLDVEKSNFPFKQKINLGLDLQGGLYMVLGVDFNKVFKEVIDRQAQGLQDRLKEKNIAFKSVRVQDDATGSGDPRLFIDFDPAQRVAIYDLSKSDFGFILRLSGEKDGELEFGLKSEYRAEVREKTIGQSIEVIRNRIDEFGVSEPSIASQGTDRLVVELPGVKEVDRAKDLIGRTAKLEFRLVDDKTLEPGQLEQLIEKLEKEGNLNFKEGQKFSDYVKKINELAVGKIPADRQIAFERLDSMKAQMMGKADIPRIPYLLETKAEVTGQDLQDANVQFNQQTQAPEVGFALNPKGAAVFDRITGDNVNRRLAIVLDNIVHSAPNINGRIPGGRGVITLGRARGDQLMKEAKDLAIVLRAGALPAQLEFLEQRVVGPSLGQDSIKKGALASLVGCLLVFVFVSIYYRISGLIATVSLLLNVLFVLAILVGMEATLTLPGIAGIALTVGIAVDSNVVIYERIREELRQGKSVVSSVEAGFQKAFRTILDANVTNAAAAAVLLTYGTGPIKGFAVSLLIGIVTTLFTAVFVCRLMFDYYLKSVEARGAKTLSI